MPTMEKDKAVLWLPPLSSIDAIITRATSMLTNPPLPVIGYPITALSITSPPIKRGPLSPHRHQFKGSIIHTLSREDMRSSDRSTDHPAASKCMILLTNQKDTEVGFGIDIRHFSFAVRASPVDLLVQSHSRLIRVIRWNVANCRRKIGKKTTHMMKLRYTVLVGF